MAKKPPELPATAADYIKRKGLKPAFSYKDVWAEEHNNAFTVAKAMQMDVLGDIKAAMEKAAKDGQPFSQFKKELAPLLAKKGWWGRKTMVDPLTGEEREVQLGSSRRLKTIYETNLRTAHSRGQFKRGMESPLHTHILYRIGPSTNHRE